MAPLLILLATLFLSTLLWYCCSYHNPREGQKGAELHSHQDQGGGPFSETSPSSAQNPTTRSTPSPRSTGRFSASALARSMSLSPPLRTVAAQFLRTHDANFSHRPPNSGAEHIAYNYQDLVFGPYGPRWRARRKLLNLHLFSGKVLDDLRPVRAGELALLVRALRDRAGSHEPVNLGRAANACATNALARATLGRRVFQEEAAEFKDMVVELGGCFRRRRRSLRTWWWS